MIPNKTRRIRMYDRKTIYYRVESNVQSAEEYPELSIGSTNTLHHYVETRQKKNLEDDRDNGRVTYSQGKP